ncbi:ABC transporter ATP-binding protein [Paraflavitalea sp. CAU 1676]|uniref:ABC transporter ATP-binding protein n=1 Tax=Paraflavitalea sp. CAU 1676 TaxID=3032598 RepID=UPI0023DCDE6E|nr:ABC transporter ATP-binding protein [Paraflavitalea sp. CAU 1676]MDF2189412.1 ABC transporter ATP-binding protein [Paraflavitalea sp. CAU 1676]
MSNHIIETQRLDFLFRSGQPILQQLSLQVPAGSIYGFLGPNGAGKTTTLRLILGLLKKQQGSITIFGKELMAHRLEILRRLGSLIEQPSLYLHLTGRENLEVFRLSYQCPKSRIDEVLDIVKLKDAANKKAKAYSLGMKQRLSIAIALLHDPELLILDEPTNGLDPSGIIETRELIKSLNRDHGKTILVSSHMLSEVEKMATHVGIITKGKQVFQGTLTQLQQLKSKQSAIEIEVSNVSKAKLVLNGHFPVKEVNGTRLLVHYENREKVALMNRTLVQEGVEVYQLSLTQNDLENLFIQITSE